VDEQRSLFGLGLAYVPFLISIILVSVSLLHPAECMKEVAHLYVDQERRHDLGATAERSFRKMGQRQARF